MPVETMRVALFLSARLLRREAGLHSALVPRRSIFCDCLHFVAGNKAGNRAAAFRDRTHEEARGQRNRLSAFHAAQSKQNFTTWLAAWPLYLHFLCKSVFMFMYLNAGLQGYFQDFR